MPEMYITLLANTWYIDTDDDPHYLETSALLTRMRLFNGVGPAFEASASGIALPHEQRRNYPSYADPVVKLYQRVTAGWV